MVPNGASVDRRKADLICVGVSLTGGRVCSASAEQHAASSVKRPQTRKGRAKSAVRRTICVGVKSVKQSLLDVVRLLDQWWFDPFSTCPSYVEGQYIMILKTQIS